MKMCSFYVIFIVCFTFVNVSAARNVKNIPSAVVVGTVHCDTCFHQGFFNFNNTHSISGASVAIQCEEGNSNPSFIKTVKTDKNGEFQVQLPLSISKHINTIKKCSVKLISSNQRFCAIKSKAISSSIHLKGKRQEIHIFSAGFFTFRPLNQPLHCTQKPTQFLPFKSMFFPINNPANSPPVTVPIMPQLPPLPQLPQLPQIPPLPSLPPLPELPKLPPILGKNVIFTQKTAAQPETFFFPPNPFQPPSLFPPNPFQPPSIFPPNPFLPPPSLFPPNPFQPPPSLLPPNPLQPPPAPFIPIPTIPFFTPSPPPPSLPLLPPFPFPPVPRIPGVPPASP